MEFVIYSYLNRHPFLKKIIKWWFNLGLYFPERLKRQIINQIHAEMISRIMDFADRNGGITVEQAMKIHYEFGKEISEILKDILSLDTNDARSLTKIIKFVNKLLDINGKEIEFSSNRVVRHETKCFLAQQLSRYRKPYYCNLFQSIYKGILSSINPEAETNNLEITQSKRMEYCEIITEIRE